MSVIKQFTYSRIMYSMKV